MDSIRGFIKKITNKKFDAKKQHLSPQLIEELLNNFAPHFMENQMTKEQTI